MNIRPAATIRQNYNDITTYNKWEKMLQLREELLVVEEDRMAGREGCNPDELDDYLDAVITEV